MLLLELYAIFYFEDRVDIPVPAHKELNQMEPE